MLSGKMEKALNNQINAEMYSAYLYLSMAAYFEANDLPGCTQWMKAQAQEEMVHAMKLYGFVNERGSRVTLGAIKAPPVEWDSALAVFEQAYEHEQFVTSLINQLMDLAIEERDHATQIFLQWFVTEQVEEEASASEVVNKIKLAGETSGGLFIVDKELGQRALPVPVPGS
ncbi:MAG TPA: ferritin [Thermodesulfobacteriaceae bacterium]|nr:ferritin [Thermodesulfobacteriaceae bacterium]